MELLNQFISKTPTDELAKLISKYENLDIEGPTFDEYLDILQNELERIDWHPCFGTSVSINQSEMNKYMIVYNEDFYPPPLPKRNKKVTKKDSVISTESFFLL